jgi:hypothetical protein
LAQTNFNTQTARLQEWSGYLVHWYNWILTEKLFECWEVSGHLVQWYKSISTNKLLESKNNLVSWSIGPIEFQLWNCLNAERYLVCWSIGTSGFQQTDCWTPRMICSFGPLVHWYNWILTEKLFECCKVSGHLVHWCRWISTYKLLESENDLVFWSIVTIEFHLRNCLNVERYLVIWSIGPIEFHQTKCWTTEKDLVLWSIGTIEFLLTNCHKRFIWSFGPLVQWILN